MSEKRVEVRIPLMARVDILWMDDDGNPRVAPATLEDKSQSGISVRMKDAIACGTHITIRWGDQQVSGVVTNCRRQKTQYIVGVKRDARN